MGFGGALLIVVGVGTVAGAISGAITRFRRGYFADVAIGVAGALIGGLMFANNLAALLAAVAMLVATHFWGSSGAVGAFVVIASVAFVPKLASIGEMGRLAKAGPEEAQRMLAESAQRMNSRLPRMIDEATRLEKVVAGPGKRLTYLYTITDAPASEYSWAQLADPLRQQLVAQLCGNRQTRDILSKEIVIGQQYSGNDGRLIGSLALAASDCSGK
jgi:uncharacterized membrane protein YeaQ/YmgE (transglycosylase-associated protein family)